MKRVQFLFCSLLFLTSAGSILCQSNPDGTVVKQKLQEILSSSEFHETSANSGPLQKAMGWFTGEWQKIWTFLQRIWNKIFGASGMLGGSYALQWIFISVFAILFIYILIRIIRSRTTRIRDEGPLLFLEYDARFLKLAKEPRAIAQRGWGLIGTGVLVTSAFH